MIIKEGQVLKVDHRRKGVFIAVATEDFDSDAAKWFPLAVAEGYVAGVNQNWQEGERILCRAELTQIVELLPSSAKSERGAE